MHPPRLDHCDASWMREVDDRINLRKYKHSTPVYSSRPFPLAGLPQCFLCFSIEYAVTRQFASKVTNVVFIRGSGISSP